MTYRNRIHLLVGLLCLWAIASVAVFGFSPEPERVPLQNVTGPMMLVSGERGELRSPGLQVDLKLFEAGRKQRAQNFSPPKNIFSTVAGSLLPPLSDGAMGAAGSEPIPGGEASTAANGELRYLGFVEVNTLRREKAVAVLASGEDLHMVRPGERIGEHLVLKAMTAEHVVVVDSRSRREQRLPLVDVVPAAPTS